MNSAIEFTWKLLLEEFLKTVPAFCEYRENRAERLKEGGEGREELMKDFYLSIFQGGSIAKWARETQQPVTKFMHGFDKDCHALRGSGYAILSRGLCVVSNVEAL